MAFARTRTAAKSKREVMSLFSRYIAAELLRPMLAILGSALFALLAERMLRVVDIVIGWRGSLLVIFEMMSYLIPHYIGLALPAALFIAILMTFSRLSRDGEFDAMLGAGAGFWRLQRPLMLISLVLMVINIGVQGYLQPYSRYAYRAAVYALSNVSFQALLRENDFVTLQDTTYTVDTLAPDHNSFTGVFLANLRENGDLMVITAEKGQVVPASMDKPVTLQLQNGLQQLLPSGFINDTANGAAPTVLRFRNFSTDLQGNDTSFRPRGMDEREYTLPELVDAKPNPAEGIMPWEITAELHIRLVRIASTLILPLIATPLAIGRRRAQRSYGFILGIILLLAFNQLTEFGKSMADNNKVSVAVGLWLPFFAFLILGIYLTWRKSVRVPSGGGSNWLDRLLDGALAAIRRLLPASREASP
ncbi:lipopolysaccharide export system permease protein [Arboricoccus pini]|uniref:Lipopolysaccharide export system permease protein n=2 Tax=Arboricoccus pini TaxID=1963835 RepID=A0A212QN49_9PROT|nr:lipopolysaccharide export system permease protein [Arboricoccus pini]